MRRMLPVRSDACGDPDDLALLGILLSFVAGVLIVIVDDPLLAAVSVLLSDWDIPCLLRRSFRASSSPFRRNLSS